MEIGVYNEHKSGTHKTSMVVCAMCRYSKMLCDIATLNGKWLKKINGGKSIAFEHLLLIFGRAVEKKAEKRKKDQEKSKRYFQQWNMCAIVGWTFFFSVIIWAHSFLVAI